MAVVLRVSTAEASGLALPAAIKARPFVPRAPMTTPIVRPVLGRAG